jgi:hypothetical protein
LAACEGKPVFTEYLLYEPILWILQTMDYKVQCEEPWPPTKKTPGDHKRIDFAAKKEALCAAIEVKWPRDDVPVPTLDVRRDAEKLGNFIQAHPNSQGFLCVFGRYTIIHQTAFRPRRFFAVDPLPDIYARFGRTQYGCRILEYRPQTAPAKLPLQEPAGSSVNDQSVGAQ